MKKRDLIKKLEKAGFVKIRDEGDHMVYYQKGYPPLPIPRHKEVNDTTAKNILKWAGLK